MKITLKSGLQSRVEMQDIQYCFFMILPSVSVKVAQPIGVQPGPRENRIKCEYYVILYPTLP